MPGAGGGGSRGWVRGQCVGRGSTAAVYLAASTSGEQPSFFAVKSADASLSAPLQKEERIMSSLCSPHIVSCLGSDVTAEPDGRVLYNLFVEYVPGGSLAEAIKRHGGLEERTIRLYTRGILQGLAYLHSRGILHCDVKGQNVLVGEDGESVKLADLGCARWVGGGEDSGAISGTPLYMAPEVARGEEQGPAADIWALGCTAIEMATGCPPWRDVVDPVAAIHRIAYSTDVPEFPCDISDDGRDFLGRCLSRDPSKRWSAEELLDHPFLKCCEEFAMDCDLGSKRSSPKSTLDQVFWDSWPEEEEEEEEEDDDDPAKIHLDTQPIDSARERLWQLAGGGVSLPPVASLTWDESCCWTTVRNGVASSSEASSSDRIGEDEPSTSWSVEEAGVGGEAESAGYSDCSPITAEGGYQLPPNYNPHSHFSARCGDNNNIIIPRSCTMFCVDEGKNSCVQPQFIQ